MFISKEKILNKYDMCEILEKDEFFIDLKYATKNNFTGKILYKNRDSLLRKSTYIKLIKAKDILKAYGYYIKIWDVYRPIEVRKQTFAIANDERYVCNPEKGNNNHCKGIAVDITLCDKFGNNLKMPTEFDYFGIESSRDYYNNLDEETRKNVKTLENAMISSGFSPLKTEWWHFNDTCEYDVIEEEYV